MDGSCNQIEFPYCSPNYNVYTFHAGQSGVGEQSPFRAAVQQAPPRIDLTLSGGRCNQPPQYSDTVTVMRQPEPVILSVSLKVINPDKRSEAKLYILRNVPWQILSDPGKACDFFVEQFPNQVPNKSAFDFGYYQGNKRVWVHSDEDLKDVYKLLKNKDSHGVTLWCDGKADQRSVKRSVSDLTVPDSNNENEAHLPTSKGRKKRTRYEEKAERIDDIVDQLKERHGKDYTLVQYRIWAETMESGQHSSYDLPPKGRF